MGIRETYNAANIAVVMTPLILAPKA
jgi:hypothetical protein